MPRNNRLLIPGSAHWVVFKGNFGIPVFKDDADHIRMTEIVAENVEDFGVQAYAYCWLDDQGHMLLEAPMGNLSKFMRNVLTRYSMGYCFKYGVSGHLLQSRFDSVVVGGDEHLLKVCRHLHLLPVHQKSSEQRTIEARKATLERYRWSNYRQAAGLDAPAPWLALDRIIALALGSGKSTACYRKYVHEALENGDDGYGETLTRLPLAIGDDGFLERVRQAQARMALRKRGEAGSSAPSPSVSYEDPDKVISEVCARLQTTPEKLKMRYVRSHDKGIAGLALLRRCGMSYESMADFFGLKSGVAICNSIRNVKAAAREDDALKALLDELATFSPS